MPKISAKHYKLARDYERVGTYLQSLRLKSGMTQREVGDILGYSSAQYISNFERGIALPPLKKLRAMLVMYGGDQGKLIELILACEREILGEGLGVKGKGLRSKGK